MGPTHSAEQRNKLAGAPKAAYQTPPIRRDASAGRMTLNAWALGADLLDAGVFLQALQNPASDPAEVFVRLSEQLRLSDPVSPRKLAISGSNLVAAGLAMTLARAGERVCLLELGEQPSLLAYLLQLDDSTGLSELFHQKDDAAAHLEHLIIKARVLAPVPNLYVLPNGHQPVHWSAQAVRLNRLIQALAKKFHRVLLCLPDFGTAPAMARLVSQVGIPTLIVFDNETMSPEQQQRLTQAIPGCRVQTIGWR